LTSYIRDDKIAKDEFRSAVHATVVDVPMGHCSAVIADDPINVGLDGFAELVVGLASVLVVGLEFQYLQKSLRKWTQH
jgi:hypothetical protein